MNVFPTSTVTDFATGLGAVITANIGIVLGILAFCLWYQVRYAIVQQVY